MNHALLFSVFIVASCGLAYELIAGALASYLLGDSVTQFSTVIGTYLFAMGIGSWLSRYVERIWWRASSRSNCWSASRRLLGGGAVLHLRLVAGAVQAGALPGRGRHRRAGRAGDSADHAHPQARSGCSRISSRRC
jgi:hypothetical protein